MDVAREPFPVTPPIVVGAVVFLWGGKNAFKFGFIGVLQIQIQTHK